MSILRALAVTLAFSSLCMLQVKAADLDRAIPFNIPEQPLAQALADFSRQSDVIVIASTDITAGKVSNPINETTTAAKALKQLLQGTQLQYTQEKDGSIIVKQSLRISMAKADGANPESADGAGSSGADPASGEGVEPKAPAGELSGIPEILVEGSRSLNADIVRTENDAQPYHIFDSQTIEQSGALNVEDFLKRGLPMNTVAVTSGQQASNFRGSQSSINLRGLGTNQTLVLINGRRTASPGLFSGTYQPDLNSIPPTAIERIEVLPSSSAAIYGGSAVGGVVNVVLKRGFTGGDVRVSYENTMDGDAPIRSIGGTYGLALEEGRTHISVSAQFSDADPLLNRDRPELLARGVSRILQNNPAQLFAINNPFWGATPNIGSAEPGVSLTLQDGTPLGSFITSIPAGFTADSDPMELLANAGSYNVNLPSTAHPLTGLRRPIGAAPSVNTVMLSFQRDMTDQLSVFADFYRSSNIGRTPNYGSLSNVLQVPASAPTNPFGQRVYVSFPDTFSDEYRTESVDRRVTTGFTLKLPRQWMVASDYTWSYSKLKYGGPIYSLPGLSADLASGVLNPFVDTLAAPLDLAKYRGTFGSSQPATLNDLGIRLAGPIFSLPAGKATLTLGLEHRKEGLHNGEFHNQKPNYPLDTQFRKYFGQSQSIDSLYAEANIPLIGEANRLPGVRELELQLSARTEHFEIGSGTPFQYVEGSAQSFIDSNLEMVTFTTKVKSTNPTIGLRFKPVDSLTLRASYGTAFLPPNYGQLVPGNIALVLSAGASPTINVVDPRRGGALTAVEYATGGNPDLKPQDSKNWNFGFILEPTFLPGLRLNVEYYKLTQQNIIFSPTAQLVVDREDEFPGRVTRAAAAPGDPYGVGALTFVDYSLFNANRGKTSGIDLGLGYRWKTSSFGSFDFSLVGTRIRAYQIQTALDGPLTDVVDQVAYNGPLQLRGNASLSWELNNWNLGWIGTYFGSYAQYDVGGSTLYLLSQGSPKIPSQQYHNLFGSYSFPAGPRGGWAANALADVTIQAGIRNVFNKVPPFDAYYTTNYFYSPFGDARLRSFYLTLAKKF